MTAFCKTYTGSRARASIRLCSGISPMELLTLGATLSLLKAATMPLLGSMTGVSSKSIINRGACVGTRFMASLRITRLGLVCQSLGALFANSHDRTSFEAKPVNASHDKEDKERELEDRYSADNIQHRNAAPGSKDQI